MFDACMGFVDTSVVGTYTLYVKRGGAYVEEVVSCRERPGDEEDRLSSVMSKAKAIAWDGYDVIVTEGRIMEGDLDRDRIFRVDAPPMPMNCMFTCKYVIWDSRKE